ncbi:MAG: acyltransferase [Clostridia bacterium]|nr:acyltransferase [Clostridia bacterium]
MTLAIVTYHYRSFSNLPCGDGFGSNFLAFYNIFCESLGALALGFFFMISGFLLYHGAADCRAILKKIKKRLYSLGVPYLLWNCIVMCYVYLKDRTIPFSSVTDLLKRFTVLPFDGPLWYITVLLLLLIPAPLVIQLKKHPKVSVVLLVGLFAFAFCVSELNLFPRLSALTYFWWLERFIRYLPAYFLGAFAAMHISRFILEEQYPKRTVCITCTVLYIASLLFLFRFDGTGVGTWLILRLQPILFWFATSSNLFKGNPPFPLQISFFIYAMHQQILMREIDAFLLPRLAQYVFAPYQIVLLRLLGVVLVYVAALIITLLCRYLLHPKFFAALSGNRIPSAEK